MKFLSKNLYNTIYNNCTGQNYNDFSKWVFLKGEVGAPYSKVNMNKILDIVKNDLNIKYILKTGSIAFK